jgi:hypothetical protein
MALEIYVGGLLCNQIKHTFVLKGKRLPKALQSAEGMALSSARVCSNYIISSSDEGIRVWEMELRKHQLSWTTVNVGKLKRIINCMMVSTPIRYLHTKLCLHNNLECILVSNFSFFLGSNLA